MKPRQYQRTQPQVNRSWQARVSVRARAHLRPVSTQTATMVALRATSSVIWIDVALYSHTILAFALLVVKERKEIHFKVLSKVNKVGVSYDRVAQCKIYCKILWRRRETSFGPRFQLHVNTRHVFRSIDHSRLRFS